MDQQTPSNLFDLQVDQQSSVFLGESARWARFLAILGFIMCGLIALFGLLAGTILTGTMSSMNMGGASMLGGSLGALVYIGAAIICFFPFLYLYRFATKIRVALGNNDQVTLSESFKNLKSYFKFYGILSIIALGFYAIALIALILGAAVGR
jgi:hypothetical protein